MSGTKYYGNIFLAGCFRLPMIFCDGQQTSNRQINLVFIFSFFFAVRGGKSNADEGTVQLFERWKTLMELRNTVLNCQYSLFVSSCNLGLMSFSQQSDGEENGGIQDVEKKPWQKFELAIVMELFLPVSRKMDKLSSSPGYCEKCYTQLLIL